MTISELDAVMRERAAFVKGFHSENWDGEGGPVAVKNAGRSFKGARSSSTKLAAALFPLPKVTRPRVVHDGTCSWRVVNGEIEGHSYPVFGEIYWGAQMCVPPTPARVKLWADLLANPTEEVEAES